MLRLGVTAPLKQTDRTLVLKCGFSSKFAKGEGGRGGAERRKEERREVSGRLCIVEMIEIVYYSYGFHCESEVTCYCLLVLAFIGLYFSLLSKSLSVWLFYS